LTPKREFAAGRGAASLCGSPHGFADALIRLEQTEELFTFAASPATEPLYTVNPFAEEGLAALFVTHPPVRERVQRLRSLDPAWKEKLRAAERSDRNRLARCSTTPHDDGDWASRWSRKRSTSSSSRRPRSSSTC